MKAFGEQGEEVFVTVAESKRAIQDLCSGVPPETLEDFFKRMDDDYFVTFRPEEIAVHVRMAAGLDSNRRLQVRVSSGASEAGEFDLVIVAFDYLSEFSIFCGALSAFGLDIRAGDVYSFSKGASPRKIVDVFRVRTRPEEPFDETKQREFEEVLLNLGKLLASGSINQAREQLNRFLIERVERMNEELSGLLSEIELCFDNDASAEWTVMEARSEDAFAFLYAISNALAMQGVYIHKVKIRSSDRVAEDQFFIANRWGRKITGEAEKNRLTMAVAMIKQFTVFLPEAPDPAKALRHFDQLVDKIAQEDIPDRVVSFLARREGMNMLAHLLGSSDFLWDEFLSLHFQDLIPILEGPGPSGKAALDENLQALLRGVTAFDEKKKVLNRFKDTQLFLIDAKHLLDPEVTVLDFSRALTDLAEVVIEQAAAICIERAGKGHGPFALFGLGKFGGREMGYASDLELLFVHEAAGSTPFFEALAREIMAFIESRSKGFFAIDLRLRPYGEKGALSISFDQFAKYYGPGGQAGAFERQALIKLRGVAGDQALGRRVEAHRDRFTYSNEPWDCENALHLRRRQIRELVKKGEVNVKYSSGGIVDIEYAVQYLQLLHGNSHPELRVPTTLEALKQLHRLRIVGDDEYGMLHPAYLFLRNLIDALRIVRGDASDLVLPAEGSEEFKSLARRLGYRERDRHQGAARLAADIRQWMQRVHTSFQERFASLGKG